MNWILIALISGMLMSSRHDTEEACLGRKAMLEKDLKIMTAKCVNMMPNATSIDSSSILSCSYGSYCGNIR